MTDKVKPSASTVTAFKSLVTTYNKTKTASVKSTTATTIDWYLNTYTNLEQYDTRNKVAAAKDPSKDYIEIKHGGFVFRKASGKLTITVNDTFDYDDANVAAFTQTLEQGLAVIAAAAKYDTKGAVSGVTI